MNSITNASNTLNKFCVTVYGILSFDLKDDKNVKLKVTDINIRYMAYTGIMAQVDFI